MKPIIRLASEPRGLQVARRRPTGFTMTEMLIVIGLIVLLIGILLPAIAGVQRQARITRTTALMEDFASACAIFEQQHGVAPGVIPEDVLANDPLISGTENALLHLLGGYRLLRPTDGPTSDAFARYNAPGDFESGATELVFTGPNGATWRLKINLDFYGLGPVIDGKQYDPYFSPGAGDLVAVQGQLGQNQVPILDLVDAWGSPIIYVRRVRTVGPLVGEFADLPQFLCPTTSGGWGGTMQPYIRSTALGDRQINQMPGGGNSKYSVFNASGPSPHNGNYSLAAWNLMMLIANEAFRVDLPGVYDYTTARGGFIVISAGADGVFFSTEDGKGSTTDPQEDIDTPTVAGEYDDIVVLGGGR